MQDHFILELFLELDLDHNFTFRGELYGITNQIYHDLAKAGGIALKAVRHLGQNLAGEFESLLMGTQAENVYDVSRVSRSRKSIVSKSSFPASTCNYALSRPPSYLICI
jgi:hypothetical protein